MNRKKIFFFVTITLLISWAAAGLFYLSGAEWGTPFAMVFAIIYMFFPLLGTVIVQKYIYKQPVLKTYGVNTNINKWFLVAWGLPVLITFATIGVSLLMPGVGYSPEMTGITDYLGDLIPEDMMEEMPFSPVAMFWLMLAQGIIAGPTINAVAAFGEELGWRGFLLKETAAAGFWESALFIGFIWGIWHAPLVLMGHNYPGYEIPGVFMMTLWCILLSPMFSYITIKANNVIAAAILHGSINAVAGLAIMPLTVSTPLLTGVMGLPGCLVLVVINLAIFFFGRPKELMQKGFF
ncbi:MAG: CPBP family intramembrane glutamic endopeptidase [Bacillota bacterium]